MKHFGVITVVFEARPLRRGTPDQPASSPNAAPNIAPHAR